MTKARSGRPRLSANILTRDSESRLARVVAEVREYADEVLVGVDATSPDGTFEVARDVADVVYRFRLPGQLSPARMLVFNHASGDWILSLDDDEGMEKAFDGVLPTILSDTTITHAWFPRKWIVSLEPCEYVHAAPWFPNWSLRMFRNDRSLVWKPNYVHSQYRVQGAGRFEERASIMHFEPVLASADARSRKLEMYRKTDGASGEEYYSIPPSAVRRAAALRPPARTARSRGCVVHEEIQELELVGLPPWKAEFVNADVPERAGTGATLTASLTVRNTGVLAWTPPGMTNDNWPYLNLGNHLLDANGELLAVDRDRVRVARVVRPGEEITFHCTLVAPDVRGDYFLEWDMVSEKECWFAECGSVVLRTALRVEDLSAPGQPPPLVPPVAY